MEEFLFNETHTRVLGYCGKGGDVVVPEGVTHISDKAFKGIGCISSVRFPASLKCIGEEAFAGCEKLRRVVFSEGLREIGTKAFENCVALEEIELPEGLEQMARYTFRGCTGLKRVVLPKSLHEVGYNAFKDCTSLADVVFPPTLRLWVEISQFENTPFRRAYEEEEERKERAYLAIRDRVRRKLSDDEVRSLKTILVEDNKSVKAVSFYSFYRTLSGGYAPEVVTMVNTEIPLADLAGAEPYAEFGLYVRAVVDDTVYLTNGLGAYAHVTSFDEREAFEISSGAYDTAICERITARRS